MIRRVIKQGNTKVPPFTKNRQETSVLPEIDSGIFATLGIDTPMLPTGKYRHYKGNEYEVIGVATHSETLAEMVVYRPLYGEGGLWVRPLDMFTESVVFHGKHVPRFEKL